MLISSWNLMNTCRKLSVNMILRPGHFGTRCGPTQTFIRIRPSKGLEAAANVAVVVDDLDPSDEVMNLLARHNIPFTVLLPRT